MSVKLPQELVKIDGATLPNEGSDHLILEFLEAGFTGYLLLRANGDNGLALFEDGEITAAYHARDGQIVGTSVQALLAFRLFEPDDCRTWASEVPLDCLPHLKTIYMGKELIPPTATNILNIQNIYETYKGTLQNGLLLITSSQTNGYISIIGGKWAFVTDKNEFNRIYSLGDCQLSLYEIGEAESLTEDKQDTALTAYSTLGKRIKETIILNLGEYFGKAAQSAIDEASRGRFSLNNYERKLDELAKFLKLFVSDKKAKPFIEDTRDEIEKMIREVGA